MVADRFGVSWMVNVTSWPGDAVRLTIYTTEMTAFAEINEVYESFFEADPPARVAIGVAALPRGAKVEIDAVVAIPA